MAGFFNLLVAALIQLVGGGLLHLSVMLVDLKANRVYVTQHSTQSGSMPLMAKDGSGRVWYYFCLAQTLYMIW